MARIFAEANIPTSIILDSAVGSVMERVDMVICGAEGVMEDGGVVNKVRAVLYTALDLFFANCSSLSATLQLGTYQVAMIAKTLRKPFYVAVESYKFARMYPLSQRDVEDMVQSTDGAAADATDADGKITKLFPHATVDFTPAKYITLLFTDLGVLTPAAVSDELIRLYQ